LTNFHIKHHPLRQADFDLHLRIMANYEKKGVEKRNRSQQKYQRRLQRQRVQETPDSFSGSLPDENPFY
jgi:hypothetical protein